MIVLDTISEDDILNNFLDLRLLFDKIIEKDEDILQDYLIKSGYIFSKGNFTFLQIFLH